MSFLVLERPRSRRPFSPSSIAGMAWGYEADRLTGADGSAIATWVDVSPHQRAATQATSSERPTLIHNQLNGLRVARYDGGDSVSASGWTLTQPYTFFCIARTTAVDAANRNLIAQVSGPAAILRKNTSNQLNLAAATSLIDALPTMANNTWFIAAAVANSTSSLVAMNGANSTTGDAGAGSMIGVTLGSAWTGDIYAAYCWNSALSTANLNRLASYFAAKTGISTWINL